MSKQNQILIVGVALVATLPITTHADNYFLTVQQKQELVLRGQLHDEQQRLYDIWIVPGYVEPLKHVQKGWRNAGEALQHYGDAKFYDDIKKYSNKTWRYGHKTILNKYTFTGSKKHGKTIWPQRANGLKSVFLAGG